MRYPVELARRGAERALVEGGYADEEASCIAEVLVEAELGGRATHGLMRLASILRAVGERAAPPRVAVDSGAFVLVDGGGGPAYLAARLMADIACERARERGAALVSGRNMGHAGSLGYYVRRAADRGLVALMAADCWALVAPPGATEALYGTNPLAAAIPGNEFHIVVDMATSSVTIGELHLLKLAGGELPPGTAYDGEGNPTRSPPRALEGAVVPFGGAKGYCLALLVQFFSSALSGARLFPERGRDYGHIFCALRPDIFVAAEEVRACVSELVERTRSLRREGCEPARLPGERLHNERARRLKEGLELAEELARRLGL